MFRLFVTDPLQVWQQKWYEVKRGEACISFECTFVFLQTEIRSQGMTERERKEMCVCVCVGGGSNGARRDLPYPTLSAIFHSLPLSASVTLCWNHTPPTECIKVCACVRVCKEEVQVMYRKPRWVSQNHINVICSHNTHVNTQTPRKSKQMQMKPFVLNHMNTNVDWGTYQKEL